VQHDLVERAKRGDRAAFEELAGGQVDRLHAIARLVMRDPDMAEDAVQETLVRCWRFLPKLRAADRFEAWLHRLLMRAIADEFGRHRRFDASVRVVHLEPSVADDTRTVANREELERGFLRLSLDHRAVVVLHHYLDLPLDETAAMLGIPGGTAKSRYHYAMLALRAALEADSRIGDQREATA
jgi:RNA polymerase sigma-70 factor (ECF subfamily)